MMLNLRFTVNHALVLVTLDKWRPYKNVHHDAIAYIQNTLENIEANNSKSHGSQKQMSLRFQRIDVLSNGLSSRSTYLLSQIR